MTSHPLDNPAWLSLIGDHSPLALCCGAAARYPAAVSVFAGVGTPTAEAFTDLAQIAEAGEVLGLFGQNLPLTAEWRQLTEVGLIQMVCEAPLSMPDRGFEELTRDDAAAMLALAKATEPGPFGLRTIEMGRYIGRRHGDRLIAMAGERLKPPGYVEVSGVCTDPGHRGRGHAADLVCAVGADIQDRGEIPFLHVAAGSASQATAVGVYERLGFRERRRATLVILERQ